MAADKEIIKVVTKLNRLTQEDKIKWERKEPPSSLITATEATIFDFYATEYKGKNMGLFEERYQDWDEEFFQRTYWTDRIVLAFFSENWEKEWEFPKSTGVYALLASVRYQVAGVEEIINVFLEDDDSKEN